MINRCPWRRSLNSDYPYFGVGIPAFKITDDADMWVYSSPNFVIPLVIPAKQTPAEAAVWASTVLSPIYRSLPDTFSFSIGKQTIPDWLGTTYVFHSDNDEPSLGRCIFMNSSIRKRFCGYDSDMCPCRLSLCKVGICKRRYSGSCADFLRNTPLSRRSVAPSVIPGQNTERTERVLPMVRLIAVSVMSL